MALISVVYLLFIVGLLFAGCVEQSRHYRTLDSIPLRIVVNGIRGKSSITRLCAGALRGGGLKTVAKTTGTAARLICPDGEDHYIYRKFRLANIIEQIGIVRRAAAYNPDALIIECMAVLPDLQEINERKLIHSTICVISNVREDHLAEMGPTLDHIARSLSRSMPLGGICVTAEVDYVDVLHEEAIKRSCHLIVVDASDVDDALISSFSSITFKENVAIALKIAELCGVSRQDAIDGMLRSKPDPGTVSVERRLLGHGVIVTVANLFAANDPTSTRMNIDALQKQGLLVRPTVFLINCRNDRIERNIQMGSLVCDLDAEGVIIMGDCTDSALNVISKHAPDYRVSCFPGCPSVKEISELLERSWGLKDSECSLVLIGNIHGAGEEFIDRIRRLECV